MFIEKVQRWLTLPQAAAPAPALPEGFDVDGRRLVMWEALEVLEADQSPNAAVRWVSATHLWTQPGRLEAWLAHFLVEYRRGIGRRLGPALELAALDAVLRATLLEKPLTVDLWSRTVALELERLAGRATMAVDEVSEQGANTQTARWCLENGLVTAQKMRTPAGRALCELRGRDAVEFALALGVELSVGPADPWRLGPDGLNGLATDALAYSLDGPDEGDSEFEVVAVERLVDMGICDRFIPDCEFDFVQFTLHPDARDLVLRVATQPDSRFRALARALLDLERGRINVETTGRGQTDLGDMSYARSVAHEIRNLLLPLHTALDGLWEELGQAQPDHARRQKLRERIDRSTDRLAEFASEAVRLSAAIHPEALVLAEVIAEATAATEAERNGRIRVVVAELADRRIHGTRRDWVGAFINLLRNAAQVRAGQGTVWISTLVDDAGGLHIFVDDDGPGVPEELRERIFDYGQSTRGGSGVGLADARRSAQASGGQLLCEAAPQGGARFHFSLPRRSTT